MHRRAPEGRRVLVAAPFGRDAASVAALLEADGYEVRVCDDIAAIAAGLDDQTGVVLLTEEALPRDAGALAAAMRTQPDWSDVPFVLLAAPSRGNNRSAEQARARLPDFIVNAVVLERPLGAASLLSAIASAMRARQKQFEMRDRLRELDESRAATLAGEQELRTIADALPILVGSVDADLRYRFANRAYEDWFHMPAEQVIGRTVREVAGEDVWSRREPLIRRALAGEAIQYEQDWPHADGRPRTAEIRYLPRRDATGVAAGFYTFALDITDRKATEQRLEARVAERTAELSAEMANRAAAEEALRQSQKMEAVGQLTGGIAHDFNNMLTGVIGSLDIMKRRLASGRTDDLDRFMEAAATSAQRAAGLTARLLAFSRRQSLDARPIDTGELVRSLEDLLRRTISEAIALHIETAEGLPLAVADANQLESALLNLAINARDAMPDGGTLTLRTAQVVADEREADLKPGRYVVLAVTDTGVGMSREVLEKVFEPFFTTKPVGQGTGLGLSMVYGFARQSGGHVRIASAPGEGTTVSLYLPAGDRPAEAVAAAPPASPRAGAGQTVLVIEDDASVRLLVREVLEELAYHVVEAGDANGALPILASDQPIALLVSDVGLPGLNGRQLAEVARTRRPDLPVLFITGYAENAAIRADFLGTNMAMITKPFALDALAAKIATMVAAD